MGRLKGGVMQQEETYVRIQYLADRKVTDIIIRKEDKEISIHKEKPVEGKSTSSKIVQTVNDITVNF